MNRHAKRGLCAEWNNAEPFFSVRTMWLAGSQFPDQGLTLGRDNDELRILTTRPPGTSLFSLKKEGNSDRGDNVDNIGRHCVRAF